jgi:hypothetical protein
MTDALPQRWIAMLLARPNALPSIHTQMLQLTRTCTCVPSRLCQGEATVPLKELTFATRLPESVKSDLERTGVPSCPLHAHPCCRQCVHCKLHGGPQEWGSSIVASHQLLICRIVGLSDCRIASNPQSNNQAIQESNNPTM